MWDMSRRIYALGLVILMILPAIAGALQLLPMLVAQAPPVVLLTDTVYVKPGDRIKLTFKFLTDQPVTITIYVYPQTGATTWLTSTVTIVPYTGEVKEIEFPTPLPYELPDLYSGPECGGLGEGYIQVFVTTTGYSDYLPNMTTLCVVPFVKVSPEVTANIDLYQTVNSGTLVPAVVHVEAYGIPEDVTPTVVRFEVGNYVATKDISGVPVVNGKLSVNVSLYETQPHWLPRGKAKVYVYTNSSAVNDNEKYAELYVVPVAITVPSPTPPWHALPMSVHGNAYTITINDVDTYLGLSKVTVLGFGFDSNAYISKLEFHNINFTKIVYTFTVDASGNRVYANESGVFVWQGLGVKYDETAKKVIFTNMTAGVYTLTVYWSIYRPGTEVYSDVFYYNEAGKKLTSIIEAAYPFGIDVKYKANLTATNVGIVYTPLNSTSTRLLPQEGLMLSFKYGGKNYAVIMKFNATSHDMKMTVMNMSETPPVALCSNVTKTNTINKSGTEYFYAYLLFNIAPPGQAKCIIGTAPTNNTDYAQLASQIEQEAKARHLPLIAEGFANVTIPMYQLLLRRYTVTIQNATLTIDYYGITLNKTITYVYPGNLSYVNGVLSTDTVARIEDNGYVFEVWYKGVLDVTSPDFNTSKLYIKLVQAPEFNQTFRAPGMLVRPLLRALPEPASCKLDSTTLTVKCYSAPAVQPNGTVLVIAFGFGPGTYENVNNTLSIYLDKEPIVKVVWSETEKVNDYTVRMGKDGNVTLEFELPFNISAGAHEVWGKDAFGLEYTDKIIVGALAYWYRKTPSLYYPDYRVSAKHPLFGQVIAEPCATYETTKYCDIKVVSDLPSEYMGDILGVVACGLPPGYEYEIYFGNIKVSEGYVGDDGCVRDSFAVPAVTEGSYDVTIKVLEYGVVREVVDVDYFYNGTMFLKNVKPYVVPKVILVSLTEYQRLYEKAKSEGGLEKVEVSYPVLVGAGQIAVIGSGFPAGVTFVGAVINDTYLPLAQECVQGWSTDSSGRIVGRKITYGTEVKELVPAIFLPYLEPGVYKIALIYRSGTELKQTGASYAVVISNLSRVATIDDVAELKKVLTLISNKIDALSTLPDEVKSAIESALSKAAEDLSKAVANLSNIAPKLEEVADKLSDVAKDVGALSSKLSELSSKIDTVKSGVDSVTRSLASIEGKISSIEKDVSSLKSDVSSLGNKIDAVKSDLKTAIDSAASTISDKIGKAKDELSGKVSDIASKVESAKSDLGKKVDDVKSSVGTVQTLVIIALILALIAAAASIYGTIQLSKKLAG